MQSYLCQSFQEPPTPGQHRLLCPPPLEHPARVLTPQHPRLVPPVLEMLLGIPQERDMALTVPSEFGRIHVDRPQDYPRGNANFGGTVLDADVNHGFLSKK